MKDDGFEALYSSITSSIEEFSENSQQAVSWYVIFHMAYWEQCLTSILGARTYAQAALREEPAPTYPAEAMGSTSQPQGLPSASQWRDEYSPQPLAKHLNQLFSPLKFPPELAHRILTHGSHQTARYHGHNSGYNFMGTSSSAGYVLHKLM